MIWRVEFSADGAVLDCEPAAADYREEGCFIVFVEAGWHRQAVSEAKKSWLLRYENIATVPRDPVLAASHLQAIRRTVKSPARFLRMLR